METVELPEYYSTKELQTMSPEDLRAAQANGFRKDVASHLPSPAPAQNERPAAEVWGSTEYDFVCPSGARCRMRKLMPEQLIEHGILDKIATLPGYAAEVVEQAEGLPPKPVNALDSLPSKEDLRSVTAILEVLIPLVVVDPPVSPVPVADESGHVPERRVGRIYTDSIELMDRVAIMERAVHGVKKLEPFRS